MKYYNNYAIATSTMNKEYVDPEEIYLNATKDEYYHMPYCEHLVEKENMIGYRSIDYVQKSYTQGEDETKYYYKHSNNGTINVNQACYYCLVQKSLYKKVTSTEKETAYYKALARERYVARMSKLPAEVEPGYYVKITTNPENTGKIFVEYDPKSENAIGYKILKIKEDYKGKSFKIYGESNDISGETTEEINARDTKNNPAKVQANKLDDRVSYTTEDKIEIKINEYNNDGIIVSYSNIEGNPDYGAGEVDSFGHETRVSSELGTGYVNVRLNYSTNYEVGEHPGAEVWANINEYNSLTIATKPIDITGRIRLKFSAGEKFYYSKNTFIVQEGDTIYCKIDSDTTWYNEEWKVDILKVSNDELNPIASQTIQYYTLRDVAGLKGFSNAVNGTEGPETGAKTSGRTFKVIEDISDVGEMAPIAGRKKGEGEWESYWFDGKEFDGQGHTISGVRISNGDDTYTAFGLFGWVGDPAKISNLKLQIEIDVNTAIRNGSGTNWICIGGIVGYSNGIIEQCEILDSSQIGSGNVIVTSEIKFDSIKLNYCVGGIVGADNGKQTKNVKVNSNVNVNGGLAKAKDESDKLNKDNDYLTFGCRTYVREYTGGIIGLKRATRDLSQGDISAVSCKVKGANNIGGVIGSNGGGNISGLEFKGTLEVTNNIEIAASGGFITFYGANAGGIVGQNLSGTISNCVNKGRINGSLNVGGIVGYSAKKDISNCKNYATIRGGDNVGGIVGESSNGTISSCINNGSISGTNDNLGTDTDTIEDDPYTGTGGIVGKLLNCSLEKSYNSGQIKGRSNVGGIAGVNSKSEINYSYNKGKIISEEMTFGNAGGICGFGSGASINGCYNIGTIRGRSCFAGIIGRVTGTNTKENISYCYNAGNFEKVNKLINEKPKGILASNGSTKEVMVNECYYRKSTIEKENEYGTALSDIDLKQQLYNWADSLKVPEGEQDAGKFIYNTIAPVENSRGYEGFGVLWWELEDSYSRIETYVCSGYANNGITKYLPIRDTFNTTLILKNGDKIDKQVLDDKKNRKEYEKHNNAKYHCWVMMIKNGTTYDIGATANNYGTRYKSSYSVNKDEKLLIVLPTGVNEITLLPSNDASVIWDRFETYVERPQRIYYGYWGVERTDQDVGTQNVKAYYSGKIDKSKENDNHRFTLESLLNSDNVFGSIYLDGNGKGKNTVANLDTYYKYKYKATNLSSTKYKYVEKLTIKEDTEKITGKAGCTVSIPIQNIQTATSEQALPFYEDLSTIESAQARVKVGIYLNESIWDKLDLAHVSKFKDDITITASFAGKETTETRKITYKWNYTENNIQWFDMNIDITNIGTKEIPDKIEVTMKWDATVIGVNVAIDKADVLVRYTLPEV